MANSRRREFIRSQLAAEMEQRKHIDIIERERSGIINRGNANTAIRKYHIDRQEQEKQDELQKANEIKLNLKKKIAQEEKLAEEINRVKHKELCDLKMRQHLRATSKELQELEKKLRESYIKKAVAAQIAEKEAIQLEEKLREQKQFEILRNTWLSNEEYDRKMEVLEMKRKHEYKKALEEQMIVLEHKKKCVYEEFLQEKKMLDDIVQRIHEEDMKLAEEKMIRMKKTKEEMEEFRRAQEIWKQKKRQELEEENRRILEFLEKSEEKAQNRKAEMEQKRKEREEMTDAMAMKLYEEELKRKEREEILMNLMDEENKELAIRQHQEEIEREIRRRIETRMVLDKQMEEREKKLKFEQEQEARFKEQMMAKMMEDARVDQMTNDRKRLKMIELRKSLQDIMSERQNKRAEEVKKMWQLREMEKEEENRRRALIEEERIKMLKEHVPNLIGYLPPGLLQTSDLSHLGPDILKK